MGASLAAALLGPTVLEIATQNCPLVLLLPSETRDLAGAAADLAASTFPRRIDTSAISLLPRFLPPLLLFLHGRLHSIFLDFRIAFFFLRMHAAPGSSFSAAVFAMAPSSHDFAISPESL